MSSTIHPLHLPETGFVRLHSVLHFVPVGKSTWWAGVKSGRYPRSYKLGPKTTAWKAEDIHQLLEELSNGGEA